MKKLHPAFLVFSCVLLIFGYGLSVLTYLLVVFLHEMGHSIVAKKLGYTLDNFYLMPYGACLSYKEYFFLEKDEFLIAIAGPLTSLFSALLVIALWWIFPVTYIYTEFFVTASLVLAIFNFLPAFPLDGARIFISLASPTISRSKAIKITLILNYVFSGLFVLMFFISIFIKVNFNFLIIALFLILGIIDGKFQGKYQNLLSFDKSNLLEKGMNAKIMAFSSNVKLLKVCKKISKANFNLFFIVSKSGKVKMLSENALKNLFETYNLNLSFSDIYPDFD